MAAEGGVSIAAGGGVSIASGGSFSKVDGGVIERVWAYVPIRQLRSVTLAAEIDSSGEGFFGADFVGCSFLHALGAQ